MVQLVEFNHKDYKLPDAVIEFIVEKSKALKAKTLFLYAYRGVNNTDKVFTLNFGDVIIIISCAGETIAEFLSQEFACYLNDKKDPVLNAVYNNSYFITKLQFN